MLGAALHYLRSNPQRLIAALHEDPLSLWDKALDQIHQQWERRQAVFRHDAATDWEGQLHAGLNSEWPCAEAQAVRALWPQVVASVAARGMKVGPESFRGFNDGDAALVRAIWCLVRHLRPRNIVETGVAHGFTSRFILEALARNGAGHLYSIDRPPMDAQARSEVGIAVGDGFAGRWTLIADSSRRCLPGLLSRLGQIDLFIHDSLHTKRNVAFELGRAWAALRPGGALVIDDIDSNGGYDWFLRRYSGYRQMVCEAEPVRPDLRRFNKKGLFAIVIKDGGVTA